MVSTDRLKKKIGYFLRFYRELRQRSQQSLANEAALSVRNYQRIENGEVMCRLDSLNQLSEILEAPLFRLLEDVPEETLGIQDVSQSKEFKDHDYFLSMKLKALPAEIKTLIHNGTMISDFSILKVSSHLATFDTVLQKKFNLDSATKNLDNMAMGFHLAQWWENIHRRGYTNILSENLFLIDGQPRLLEVYHKIISSVPQLTSSIGIVRDRTSELDWNDWLKQQSQNLR